MAEAESDGLVKIVEGFIAEKEAMAAKEKKLVEDLNAVLGRLGYRVVPAKAASGGTDAGKKRGRPPGSGQAKSPGAAATS